MASFFRVDPALRSICDSVGKEVEQWSYEALDRPAEEISFSREVDGRLYWFSLEPFNTNKSGDLHICIALDPAKQTFRDILRVKPSYVFWKRPDGSVYY